MKKGNEYVGVFDYKESDTFRPTIESRIHEDYPVSKTLTCREDSCCVIERERESNLRIRKLTPKECMRLMGFTDDDYQALVDCGLSPTQIFHIAGDGIVTLTCAYLLGSLFFDEDEVDKRCKEYVETLIEDKD